MLAINAADWKFRLRAGEYGRGFAVVADEVRTLASRTQDATEEIKTIIEQLQTRSKEAVAVVTTGCEKANSGVDKATAAGVALNDIAGKVADIDDMNALIATAAKEQCAVAEEVSQTVVRISQLTEKTTEGSNQASQASQELAEQAANLQGLASHFKV
ncbi:MAG: methyl-accepting chemotaxis protein [Gammaproteobacteria bacterium]|nr:methyl-accepting chemotaxis protein [Gammaproteobacteria bacterium]